MKFTTLFGFCSIAAAAAIPEDGSGAASPAQSQQAPSARRLLPWVEATKNSDLCKSNRGNEETCGTKTFCEAYDLAYTRPDSNYASSKECFEARQLPWVEATKNSDLCKSNRGNEETCGTKTFCEAYDSAYTRPDSNYASSKECFEARQLPWVKATENSDLCKSNRGNEETCGTKTFCEAYDSAYTRPDSNYASSKECFAHHAPDPVQDSCN